MALPSRLRSAAPTPAAHYATKRIAIRIRMRNPVSCISPRWPSPAWAGEHRRRRELRGRELPDIPIILVPRGLVDPHRIIVSDAPADGDHETDRQ